MCFTQVSKVIHFLHIVFSVIINFKIPNHFLSVSQYNIVFAKIILEILIEKSTALAHLSYYVK